MSQRDPWFAALREKAGDGTTDYIVEVRQADLRRLLACVIADECERIGRHVCGPEKTASRADWFDAPELRQ